MAYFNDEKYLKCEDCGVEGPTVKKTFCPYAEDVHGKKIEVVLCDDCYTQRVQDI